MVSRNKNGRRLYNSDTDNPQIISYNWAKYNILNKQMERCRDRAADVKEEINEASMEGSLSSDSSEAASSAGTNGRWSEQDSLRFVVFIHKFQHIFNSKHQRKSFKIFKVFSNYFTKRSPSQCRSHFQKLLLKHKTIAKLRRFYLNKFGHGVYGAQLSQLESFALKKDMSIESQKKEIGIQTDTREADLAQEQQKVKYMLNNSHYWLMMQNAQQWFLLNSTAFSWVQASAVGHHCNHCDQQWL